MLEEYHEMEKDIVNDLCDNHNCGEIHALEVVESLRNNSLNYTKDGSIDTQDDNGEFLNVSYNRRFDFYAIVATSIKNGGEEDGI